MALAKLWPPAESRVVISTITGLSLVYFWIVLFLAYYWLEFSTLSCFITFPESG
jgi:hypothetical protein